MKKFKQKRNNRLMTVFGGIAFLTLLMISAAFAAPIEAVSTDIAAALVGPDAGRSIIDTIAGGIHVMTAGASLLVLKDIEGNEFTLKSDEEIDKMDNKEKGIYIAEVIKWYGLNMARLEKEAKTANEERKTAIEKEIAEIKESQFKQLESQIQIQGEAITMLKNAAPKLSGSAKSQVHKFIKDNADKIKEMHAAGSGHIEFSVKAPEDITTGNVSNPGGIPQMVGTQMAPATNVNLRLSIIDGLVTRFQTSLASYPYTESVAGEGDVDFTAEGALKSQIDFDIQTRYAEPKKAAGYMILTEESVKDIAGLQSTATSYLRAKHDLKRQDGILFGDGVAPNPEGSTVIGRAFVAGAMAASVTKPNFMDIVNACITDIFTTHNYQDEMPYMANLVLVNPVDFYIELVSAKDDNGLPLYPQAGLFNQVNIGGVTIVPFYKIPAGKIHVADMAKYNTTNYVDYTVRIGWINDQFITNKFTMVGESRFHAFVRQLDRQAFIYDDIATVRTAINKP